MTSISRPFTSRFAARAARRNRVIPSFKSSLRNVTKLLFIPSFRSGLPNGNSIYLCESERFAYCQKRLYRLLVPQLALTRVSGAPNYSSSLRSAAGATRVSGAPNCKREAKECQLAMRRRRLTKCRLLRVGCEATAKPRVSARMYRWRR